MSHSLHPSFAVFQMVPSVFLHYNYKAAFSRKYLTMELDHGAEENNHIIRPKNILKQAVSYYTVRHL